MVVAGFDSQHRNRHATTLILLISLKSLLLIKRACQERVFFNINLKALSMVTFHSSRKVRVQIPTRSYSHMAKKYLNKLEVIPAFYFVETKCEGMRLESKIF